MEVVRRFIYGSLTLFIIFIVFAAIKYTILNIAPAVSITPEQLAIGLILIALAYGFGYVVTDFIDG